MKITAEFSNLLKRRFNIILISCLCFTGIKIQADELSFSSIAEATSLDSIIFVQKQAPNGEFSEKVKYNWRDHLGYSRNLYRYTFKVNWLYDSPQKTYLIIDNRTPQSISLKHRDESTRKFIEVNKRIYYWLPVFEVELQPGSNEFQIDMKFSHQMQTHFRMQEVSGNFDTFFIHKFLPYFTLGATLALVIFNFLVSRVLKDSSYLPFVWYGVGTILVTLGVNGFYYFVFGHEIYPAIIGMCGSFCLVGAGAFTREYLSTSKFSPKMDKALKSLMVIASLNLVCYIIGGPADLLTYVTDLLVVTMMLVSGVACAATYKHQRKVGNYFVLSWGPVFLGVFAWYGQTYGVLEKYLIFEYGPNLGFTFQLTLLSIALGDRFRRMNDLNRVYLTDKRLLEDELADARVVQNMFIPQSINLPNIETINFYESSDSTGGDWLNYRYLEDQNILFLFMGDVTGHGVASALITAVVSGGISSFFNSKEGSQEVVNIEGTLKEIACEVNQLVYQFGRDVDKLMTMMGIGIHLGTGEGVYFNAGHPPTLFTGRKTGVLFQRASPMGIHKELKVLTKPFTVQSGDRMLLYTDGLVENEEYSRLLSVKRLGRLLKNCNCLDDLDDKIKTALKDVSNKVQLDDDVSYLLIEFQNIQTYQKSS